MKSLFLIECSADHWIDVARKLTEFRIAKWTAWDRLRSQIGPPFHNTLDAKLALHADGTPPRETLFDEACERVWRDEAQIVYDMMSRFDHSRDQRFIERASLFADHICLWRSEIDRHRPDLVVFSTPPHVVYDYVLLALCRVLEIPTLMFEEIPIFPPYSIAMRDYREGSIELAAAAKKSYPVSEDTQRLVARLRGSYDAAKPPREVEAQAAMEASLADGRKYIKTQIKHIRKDDRRHWGSNEKNPKIVNTASLNKEAGTPLRSSFVGRFANTRYTYQWLREIAYTEKLRQAYVREQVDPETLRAPYIYFPLAGQPERTSNPQADIYTNQLLIVRLLMAARPAGYDVIVKEHPNQFHPNFAVNMCRDEDFYAAIARLGAKIVHLKSDPFLLIDNATCVATTGGTSAIEAAARDKFALLFGDAWYRHCPGVHRVRNLADLRRLFARDLDSLRPAAGEFANYIEAIRHACFVGIADAPGSDFQVDRETNVANLVEIVTATANCEGVQIQANRSQQTSDT